MGTDPTPAVFLAAALQHLFEICSRVAAEMPEEERRPLAERLERLQRIRMEILDWIDDQR